MQKGAQREKWSRRVKGGREGDRSTPAPRELQMSNLNSTKEKKRGKKFEARAGSGRGGSERWPFAFPPALTGLLFKLEHLWVSVNLPLQYDLLGAAWGRGRGE